MRTLWTFHRRLFVAVIVVAVLAVSSAVVLAGSHHGRPRPARPRAASRPRHEDDAKHEDPHNDGRQRSTWHRRRSARCRRRRYNARSMPSWRRPRPRRRSPPRERSSVPAPGGVRLPIPSVPTADRGDPGTYAIAFATELLDTNFAVQSRDALLAWAEHEEAPNTLPGVPASVAGKALVLSLADPDLPGGSPSPVPSARTVGRRRRGVA